MKKRVISLMLIFSIIMTFCTFVLANDTPSLSQIGESISPVGKSIVFQYDNITPDSVYVNDIAVEAGKYVLDFKMNKLYVYGSIFSEERVYTVSVKEGDITAQAVVTTKDMNTEKEYNITGGYTAGSRVSSSSTAGPEHSALGSFGGRRVLKVSLSNTSEFSESWIKWEITDKGLYTIDYWSPRLFVCVPVDVTVTDKNGEHVYEEIYVNESNARYVTLSSDGENPDIFDFTGDGEYSLKVEPNRMKNQSDGGGQNLILFDSFKITSSVSEHDMTTPSVTSDKYSVENGMIEGVLFNTSEEELINNISIPSDCTYTLSMSGDIISKDDVLVVKKLFDENMKTEYTIGDVRYLSSAEYTVGYNTISDVPYAEDVEEFVSNINRSDLITVKVFTGTEEKRTGAIQSGDVIVAYLDGNEVDRYTIEVIPASSENTITSSVYTITGNTIGIPYGEKASDFMANIIVSEFADVEHRYSDRPDAVITKGFTITVTAQNGEVNSYTVEIELGNSAQSELESNEYSVTSGVVSLISKNTDASSLLSKLSATNGGEIKLYDKNMNEKTSGVVLGTDTIKVFPRYKSAGEEYSVYSVAVEPDYKVGGADSVIWSCADDEKNPSDNLKFECTDYEDGNNFITKRVGYNETNADRARDSYYHYTAMSDEAVRLSYFAVANVENDNNTYKLEIYKNETKLGDKEFVIRNSTLCDLGVYELNTNDILTVYISGLKFISAAVITPLTYFEAEINNFSSDSDDFGMFDVSFNFEPDSASISDGVKIVSENANVMPYTYELTGTNVFSFKTKYPIERGVRYFVTVDDTISAVGGDTISRGTSAMIPVLSDKVRATLRCDYVQGDAAIDAELNLYSENSTDVKVLAVQYSGADIVKVEMYNYSITGGQTLTEQLSLIPEQNCTKLSVYILDESGNLFTNTYYAD